MIRTAALLVVVLSVAAVPATLVGQDAAGPAPLLQHRPADGRRLTYVMHGFNDGANYQVTITSTAVRGEAGILMDELAWSNLTVNGNVRELPPSSRDFRLHVTLGGDQPFVFPDLSQAPGLIGPVTDVMTFYADLFVASRTAELRYPGHRTYFRTPVRGSWADGTRVVVGEDHVDFDITLTDVDEAAQTASLLVKHVVPADPQIQMPVDWMRVPVAGGPNNYVQVVRTGDAWMASVGEETFEVRLTVNLRDGSLIAADMSNPVTKITRRCVDAALTDCADAVSAPTIRRIRMALVPSN